MPDMLATPLILIVDDIPENLLVLEKMLKRLEVNILRASSGNEALAKTLDHDFALIILDVQMPGMDGFEVAELLRDEDKTANVPIIFVTAIDHSDTKEIKGYTTGAVDFIYKPFNELILLSKVRVFLELHKMKARLEALVETRTQELTQSETKYRRIFEDAMEGIYQVDVRGAFIDANPAMARILGYASAQELMRAVTNIPRQLYVNPEDRKTFYAMLKSEGSVSNFECRLYHRQGHELWVALKARAVLDDKGKILRVQGLMEDITERKQMQIALQTAYERLEQRVQERTRDLQKANQELKIAKEAADAANRSKSMFLANMSHEIRTPLNGVIASADLALAEDVIPRVERYLKIIQSSGMSLLGIINDILDFSKIEAGRLELESRPFDLDQIMENVIDLFTSRAAEKQIELLVDMDHRTPRSMIGDSLRLQQIIVNLVSNAVKFTDKGGRVSLGIHCEELLDSEVVLRVHVQDTGVGIDETYKQHLFSPFTQADASTTRKYGGTGLGLTISRRLAEMMDGRIWVESQAGKGSTFFFTVRLQYDPKAKKRVSELPDELKSAKALIVDKSAASRELLDKMLTHFGLQTQSMASGEKARDFLAEQKKKRRLPNLILLDYSALDADGLETARHIRQDLKIRSPIILMTRFGRDTDRQHAEEAEINAFLTKPVSQSLLFNVILEVFGHSEPGSAGRKKPVITPALMYRKHLQGAKILVVEDNVVNQTIATAILDRAGVRTEVAQNGRQAVEAVKAKYFDAVLMDVQMPEMDGFEATRTIRKWEEQESGTGNQEIGEEKGQELDPSSIPNSQFPIPNSPNSQSPIPIIAMTAHALKGDEEKCLEAGMDAYVSKPINQERLFQVLTRFIRLKHEFHGAILDSFPQADIASYFPKPLAGIDIETALARLNITPGEYRDILIGFLHSFEDTASQLHAAFDAQAWDEMQNLAHSLKGSAGNISAKTLFQQALDLETDLKQGITGDRLLPDIQGVESELQHVLASLRCIQSQTCEPAPTPTADRMDKQQVAQLLRQLLESLHSADPVQIESHFRRFMQTCPQAETEDLNRAIENYDWDSAVQDLEILARQLEITIR